MIAGLFLVLSILFVIKKDEIAKYLLLQVNYYTYSELVIDNISFNPIINFPDIAITLHEAALFDRSHEVDSLAEGPFLSCQKMHVSFDLQGLFQGNVFVNAISFRNGSVRITQLPDSSWNVANAFTSRDSTDASDDIEQDSSRLNISIEAFELENISIAVEQIPQGTNQQIHITDTKARLHYSVDSVFCDLRSYISIEKIHSPDGFRLTDEEVQIDAGVSYQSKERKLSIRQSFVHLATAQFICAGTVDLKENASIDLDFVVHHARRLSLQTCQSASCACASLFCGASQRIYEST